MYAKSKSGLTLLACAFCAATAFMPGCATNSPMALGEAVDKDAAHSAVSPDYLIGPEDSLHIFVWDNPELSTTVPVRPDGRITTPLVEDVQASGKTPTQLARELEQNLSQYINNPKVTVTVTGFVGRYNEQVRIIGQAAAPRALPYRENMTVLDAIIVVGGLTEFAAGNRAKIMRNSNGKVTEYPIRLDDLINKGDVSQNMKLMPGDILVIPESMF